MILNRPLGYTQITDVSSAVAVTPLGGATAVLVSVEGSAVRWRDDGTAPTASVGMPLAVGTDLYYVGGDLSKLQIIEQEAGATVNLAFYNAIS